MESCPFCERRAIELKRNLDRKTINAALNWVWWHMQEEIGIQMKILRYLDHKSATNQFHTSEDFLIEVKRKYALVLMDPKVNDKGSLSAYRKLHEIATREIDDFQRCFDCFNSRHRYDEFRQLWICNVCTVPHLLVYAKLAKYPFWPAKVLANKKNSDEILCRFFGSQNESWISVKNCYLLSDAYPDDVEPKDKRYLKAKEEVQKHVKMIHNCYPSKFHLAPRRHAVNPAIINLFDEPMFCNGNGINGKQPSAGDSDEGEESGADEQLAIMNSELQTSYSSVALAENDVNKQKRKPVVNVEKCKRLERMIGKQNEWCLAQFAEKSQSTVNTENVLNIDYS
ncbi:zinc finger and mynd domain-containing protein-like protein [Leptotrombidium deliense]|uniref:Zinc finger and mynd domain-containing protein-like protein n=1 Tax=Leptotrombidium deliense TaxID=299467 RepID=A0A443SD42_9ACAR|nr:zinc finger and mynd domain-containing protein-like protein [Leptotrombidium deliense]